MTPSELQRAGYYCTPNPWDVRVDLVHNLPGGMETTVITTVKYQDGMSLDQRMALGWQQAEIHWVSRRLAGEL